MNKFFLLILCLFSIAVCSSNLGSSYETTKSNLLSKIKQGTADFETYVALLEVGRNADLFKEEYELLTKMKERYPDSIDVYFERAAFFLKEGRTDLVKEELKSAEKLDKEHVAFISLKAATLYLEGKSNEAINLFKLAKSKDESIASYYEALAKIYSMENHQDTSQILAKEVVTLLNTSTSVNSSNLKALSLLSAMYLEVEKPEKCFNVLNRILQIEPMSSRALLARAYYFLSKKNYAKAALDIGNLMQWKSDNPTFHALNAECLFMQGKKLEAVKIVDTILREDENFVISNSAYAQYILKKRLSTYYNSGKILLNRAINNSRKNDTLFSLRASFNLMLGDTAAAISDFESQILCSSICFDNNKVDSINGVIASLGRVGQHSRDKLKRETYAGKEIVSYEKDGVRHMVFKDGSSGVFLGGNIKTTRSSSSPGIDAIISSGPSLFYKEKSKFNNDRFLSILYDDYVTPLFSKYSRKYNNLWGNKREEILFLEDGGW